MRGLPIVVFLVSGVIVVAACSGGSSKGFDSDGTGDGGLSSGAGSSGGASSGSSSNGPSLGSDQGGGCKAGHYAGSFTGTYTSYLTYVGVPIPVTGDVSLDLQETKTGGGGEFPTFTIANGTVKGTADFMFPYFCNIVGTLDCATMQIVDGGLRNCTYCLGVAFGDLADGGTCFGGHFEGPLAGVYDSKTSSFASGTWNGSEKAAASDGGLPEGGSINDAGIYVGPGNFGGSGTWTAAWTGP
jgi:hypothetical protein